MAEFIEKTDTLNQGRVKLNSAIKDAEDAKNISEEADEKATQALANSESTQTQLDTIVIEGDSSVEAAQARVDAEGKSYPTLKARLDAKDQYTKDIVHFNIREHGAKSIEEDPLFDNSTVFNHVVSIMKSGQTLVVPDTGESWRIDKTVFVDKPIQILFNNSKIEYHGLDSIAFKFGVDDKGTPNRNNDGVYLDIQDLFLVNKATNNTTGIELCNVTQAIISNVTVTDFDINLLLVGRNNLGTQHSTFYNTRLFNGNTNLKFLCENGGWVNENTFIKGTNNVNDVSKVPLEMKVTDKNIFNNNKFNNVNFENRTAELVLDIDNAQYNDFVGCRMEGLKPGSITMGANTLGNVFQWCLGLTDYANARFSNIGKNVVISPYGGSMYHGGSGNRGVLSGINHSETSDNGYPVFYTVGKHRPNEYAFGLGQEAIVGFRERRTDYPFFYVDRQTGKMYLTSGYFPLDEQPYIVSNSKAYMEINNDNYTDVGFRIGDDTKPAYLILGNYYIWVDSQEKLRIKYGKPSDIDTDGVIVGTQD